jgi:hypothetical protein
VFLCCVFGLDVVCLVSSITCFCVGFLVYTLCVLYPVLRVSVLCFLFIRCVSCIQYDVFLCCVFSLCVVLQTNQKHNTETRNTGYKTHNI